MYKLLLVITFLFVGCSPSVAQINSPFEEIRVKLIATPDSANAEHLTDIIEYIETEYGKVGVPLKVKEIESMIDPYPELAASFDGKGFEERYLRLRVGKHRKFGIPWITVMLVSAQQTKDGPMFKGLSEVCLANNSAFMIATAGEGLDPAHTLRVVRHELGHSLGAVGSHATGTTEATIMNGDGETFSEFTLAEIQKCLDAAKKECLSRIRYMRRKANNRCKTKAKPKRCLKKAKVRRERIFNCD